MRALLVDALKFKYSQNDNFAVDDVSFQIEKGSYTAIVGLNGSGKSTLARILCGLEEPTSGSVIIDDNPRIGIVFQSPKDQIVSGLVYRDTAFGPQNLHLTSGEVELRTIESLNVTGMLDRAESSTAALSLGQTQKIALSGIIALHPEILIMDEAIAMLDPVSRADILEFLRYWHKCGNTIIHITHDMDAIREADNIIGMEEGKLYYNGDAKTYFSQPQLVKKIEGEPIPVTKKTDIYKKEKLQKTLSLHDLCFEYDKKSAIKNVSFDLYKGTLTALTGPSGAGKSTILELCSGLLKPSCGEIHCPKNASLPTLAQQNSQAALFEGFAADDVAFGPINKGIKGSELVELVKNSMNQAFLPYDKFGERRTFELSGGEQRRLSIAGILAMNSEVVFFDEPTAGLDSQGRIKVLQMMRSLAEQGKTVMFSTHKQDEAGFADREIKISNGKKVFDSASELKSNEECEAAPIHIYESASMLDSLRNSLKGLSGVNVRESSLIRKMPAWSRILLFLVLFIVAISGQSLLFCAACLCVSAVYAMISGLKPTAILKSCIKILPFLLIFAVFQMIFHPALEGEVHYTEWKWFLVTPSKIMHCVATMFRTFAAIACITGLYVSTPEYDLIDGLKFLLKPLELIKVPVRYLILIIEIIFRFIPLLVEVTMNIVKTQLMRGGLGKVKGKIARIKAVIPLIAPMVIQTIKRSEALADAITVRCFK